MKSKKPRVREDGLVIKELPEETLVYDLDRHRAHCLNQTAAFVFKHCDGRTSVKRMSTLLQKELKAPPGKMDETVVWLALDKLAKARLLQERISGPPEVARFGRRELVRRLGLVGGLTVLLPLVTSIVAPTPAEASATCVTSCGGEDAGTPSLSCPPFDCITGVCDGLGGCL